MRSRLAAVPPELGVIIVGHGTPPSGSCSGMPRHRCAPAVDSRAVDRVPGVCRSARRASHVIGGSLTGAPRRSAPGSPVGTRCPSIQHVRDHRINAGPADCSPRATPKSRTAYRLQRRDAVAEVKRPGALHHEGVLEHDVAVDELAEVARTPVPNSTGTWLTQSSSTRPRLSACWMMSALAIVTNLSPASSFAYATASSTLPVKVVRGNRSCRLFGRRTVGHDDHWRAGGMVVAPAVGLVEQPTAGDQRATTGREILQHRGACGVDREAHVLLSARHHDVAVPVPVEQLRWVVVGLGDEPVQ